MADVSAAAASRPTPTALSPAEDKRLRATAHEIESIFLAHMLKTMRQASGGKGAPLSGQGQRVYQEMMDEHLGRALSKGGGIGLSDMLVRDVLRRQGVTKNNPSSPAVDVPKGPAGGLP
jgi:Rod binding domain-containing protein